MSFEYCDVVTTGTVKGKGDRGIWNGPSKFLLTMINLLRYDRRYSEIVFGDWY